LGFFFDEMLIDIGMDVFYLAALLISLGYGMDIGGAESMGIVFSLLCKQICIVLEIVFCQGVAPFS
jgi:hypothetical protein